METKFILIFKGNESKKLDTNALYNDSKYLKSLKSGDIVGIFSTEEKAQSTSRALAETYNLSEDFFNITEIIWD